jgi:hypothetical protein
MSINAPLDVAACLDAHVNFLAHDGITHCNTYAAAFFGLRGLVIPLLSANDLYEWFASPKAIGDGWRASTYAEALTVANASGDGVCVRKEEPHGHVAPIIESLPGMPSRLCVSAAGRENFIRAPIERSFGELRPTDRFFIVLPK